MIELRTIAQDDFEPYQRVAMRGFSEGMSADDRESELRTFEFERALVAVDGGEFVGTAGAYSFEMTVPGGTMPTAGVTWVAVQPTHRRRGVLTAMMRRQLTDVHERGEPLALLEASESVIYGRFGYGMAIPHEQWEIAHDHAAFARPVEVSGRVRLVEREEARRAFPAVYARAVCQRPGMIARSDPRWENLLREPGEKAAEEPTFYALYEQDGEPEGYAVYKPDKGVFEFDAAQGRRDMRVSEQIETSPEAHAALWQFLLGIDLVTNVLDLNRSLDDALPWMLADPRRLKRRVSDHNWLRLVDVEAALAGRTYAHEGRIVFDVRDEVCPWNEGRYALEVEADGSARCERTTAEAGLALDAATLATPFLGATPLGVLAHAHHVDVRAAEELRLAEAMFRTDRAPWNVVRF